MRVRPRWLTPFGAPHRPLQFQISIYTPCLRLKGGKAGALKKIELKFYFMYFKKMKRSGLLNHGSLLLTVILLTGCGGCAGLTRGRMITPRGRMAEISADHSDVRAVRAILDANGLLRKTVEGVAVFENGRIVELYLQESGIRELTADIGQLKHLRRLHLYGDRSLGLPLLESIAPEIGRCSELEELLLNSNELTTLPETLMELRKLRRLSIADNRLFQLSPELQVWIERLEPRGLADQRP